jgi:CRP-like cAMP-binding protein
MENTDNLINYLKQNSSFNDEEIIIICSYFQSKSLLKEEILFEEGNRFSKIVFVSEGILRSFIRKENGDEIIKNFITENEFFTEIESFEKNLPCTFNVSAITKCKIFTISKENSLELSNKIPGWEFSMRDEAIKAMNSLIRKQEFLSVGEAPDKYKYFVHKYPKLAQQIPLKYIASYLNITQSSLSRIRKDIW